MLYYFSGYTGQKCVKKVIIQKKINCCLEPMFRSSHTYRTKITIGRFIPNLGRVDKFQWQILIAKLCRAGVWYCGRRYNCKIGQKSCFKLRKVFFFKLGKVDNWNCARNFFYLKTGENIYFKMQKKNFSRTMKYRFLNSTIWNGGYHVYRNYSCVTVVKFAT